MNFIKRFRTLLLLIGIAAGCSAQTGEVWRTGDASYIPFPVQEMVVSPGNRFIGLTVVTQGTEAQTTADLQTYVLDLKTGRHRLIGPDGLLVATTTDHFIYAESGRSSKPPLLLHGLETVKQPDIGTNNGVWWNGATATALFESGWPEDREGFNTLTLLRPATGGTVQIQLKEASELLGVCSASGNFYTEHRFSDDELGVDEYNGTGVFLRTVKSPLAVYSANCRYVLPFNALSPHGPDDWAVFAAASQTRLMDFPWNEDGESDQHWFNSWNPHYDRFLLMYSTNVRSKTDTIDLLDVEARAVIKSWPSPGSTFPVRWAADGEATVTVHDRHIVFEALPAGH